MKFLLCLPVLLGILSVSQGQDLRERVNQAWAKQVVSERQYLKSLLQALEISEDSQTLVFSKTSHQIAKISPQWPRAIYFNEDYYVGYVREGLLEVIEIHPQEGARFYTLERPENKALEPVLVEDESCVSCHEAHHDFEVAGLMVRSVYPDHRGQTLLRQGSYRTTTASPLSERWGGWWVTGNIAPESHMGNRIFGEREPEMGRALELEKEVDTSFYLNGKSDVLALMLLEHQSEFHNLLAQCRRDVIEAQKRDETWRSVSKDPNALNPIYQGLLKDRATQMLKCLLFAQEAALPEHGIQGDAAFEKAFLKRATSAKSGRSLRDLQLQSRLFKHRCSYMIYTRSFQQLPSVLLEEISRQLQSALEGHHPELQHLPSRERARIHEILMETAPFLTLSALK